MAAFFEPVNGFEPVYFPFTKRLMLKYLAVVFVFIM